MPLNVLFITADQWRAECLSALDHPVVRTPNLDALAREGVLFANHFANAVPCGPSRTSLHTGMYLQNHRLGPTARRWTRATPIGRKARIGYDRPVRLYRHQPDPREPTTTILLRTYEGPLWHPAAVLMGELPFVDGRARSGARRAEADLPRHSWGRGSRL